MWTVNITDCSQDGPEGALSISSIDPNNYPLNDDSFEPTYMKALNETPFHVLRFMEFVQTNNSPNKKMGR